MPSTPLVIWDDEGALTKIIIVRHFGSESRGLRGGGMFRCP